MPPRELNRARTSPSSFLATLARKLAATFECPARNSSSASADDFVMCTDGMEWLSVRSSSPSSVFVRTMATAPRWATLKLFSSRVESPPRRHTTTFPARSGGVG